MDHISLIVICSHFAVAANHTDCGQIEHCVTDPKGNVWCSLFNNASMNDFFTMKIHKNVSSATIDDESVKIYWNTHTQDMVLKVQAHDN